MEDTPVRDLVTTNEDEPKLTNPWTEPSSDAAAPDDVPSRPRAEAPALTVSVQHWVDQALNFFSHASNETLGACFVGLGASTYLVLGRVGLVLIGVVGGIALHATWEGTTVESTCHGETTGADTRKRRELGLEVVKRVWKWRDARPGDQDSGDKDEADVALKLYQGKTLDFSGYQPETQAALEEFTSAIIRDYVKWWYSPVLPGEEAFPSASRQTLTAFLLTLSSHMSRKRPAEVFLNFVINSSSIFIAFLSELSIALNASPNTNAVAAVETYVNLKPESSMAQMLDRVAQDNKLDVVAEDILQNYLEAKAYNFPPAHIFLQKILSKLILGMTLDTCARAEWINEWIVYLLEEGEPELMQAIDAGVQKTEVAAPEKVGAAGGQEEAARSAEHKLQMSRAEEAMDQAMQEAQRLTRMIREEEAKRLQAESSAASSTDDFSESTTHGIRTPTSSQSESERVEAAKVQETAPKSEAATTAEPIVDDVETPVKPDREPVVMFTPISPSARADDEPKPILTLTDAKLSIFDDSIPGDTSKIKSKPTAEYLIQIEPYDSRFSGWMIARKYADFEVLHEVLRRISVITGVVGFAEKHAALPPWKQSTKTHLRIDLEQYLNAAVKYPQLAECEGMKRFLEKDQGLSKSPASNKGLGWPDPKSVTKGMVDVLTKAPKEVTSGGKSLFGGVTSVLGGGKKTRMPSVSRTGSGNLVPTAASLGERPSMDLNAGQAGDLPQNSTPRESMESSGNARHRPPQDVNSRPSTSSRASMTTRPSIDVTAITQASPERRSNDALPPLGELNLPPPPSKIDNLPPISIPSSTGPITDSETNTSMETPTITAIPRTFTPSASKEDLTMDPARSPSKPGLFPSKPAPSPSKPSAAKPPLTEQEATVTVDLVFAAVSELYTLSSAWTFRRTLLQAARTFLLRPGNPQLEAIRALIQDSVIDAHASDAGIAALVRKTRENSLPTPEELAAWPAPRDEAQKEALRIKARRLLVERGMPQALTSVMGAAASGEALGKVFDALQDARAARALMFGLMLQGLRAVVQ